MNSCCSIILLLIAVVSCNAGDAEIVSKAPAEESNLAIVKEKGDGGNYFFVNTRTGERLADVLPPDFRDTRVNGIETSWSPDGSKVAVLVSYGTKLNGVLLFSLSGDRKMRLVNFSGIDPIKIYDERNPEKHFSRLADQAPGYDENAVGDWIANDTVKIVQGVAKEDENGTTTNFLVVLEVKIVGDRSRIVKLSPVGVLSEGQARRFLNKWKH
jgi:hypothetical protein